MGVQQSSIREQPCFSFSHKKKKKHTASSSIFTPSLGRSDCFLHSLMASADLAPLDKCQWLRSQIIGHNSEIPTPFGARILTYADHTATGRSLLFIENFILTHVLPSYGNTHTDDSFVGARSSKMVKEAACFVKDYLGGSNDDVLLFCGSGCTAAIKRLQEVTGLAVPSILRDRILSTMPSQERWIVFTGPFEHHSNLLSWRQSLAEVVEIPLNQEGLFDMVALKAALESPEYASRSKLGAFSACSNVTGYIIDTRAISRLLHEHGAFACFDFAASAPHVKLEMHSGEADGYDAIVLSPHKFMGGPGSPGILLMSKRLYLLKNHPPSTCGGGTVHYVNHFNEKDTLYSEDIEEREDAGTPAIVQKIRCALAFWTTLYIGFDLIERRESYFIKTAIQRLLHNPNVEILGNTEVRRASILSFLVKSRQPEEAKDVLFSGKHLHGRFIVKLLNDLFGIQARGGCVCAGPFGHFLMKIGEQKSLAIRAAIKKGYEGVKPALARVSFPYYMSKLEFDYLLSCIEFVATYGQRFLSVYGLDWKTGNWTIKDGAKMSFSQHNVENKLIGNYDYKPKRGSTYRKQKYSAYLKTAKDIAESLPEFPPKRHIPPDIDPHLLAFTI